MLHTKTYRKAFWTGLAHALMVVLYTLFVALVWLSLVPYLQQSSMPALVVVLALFIMLVSTGVIAYIIFFAPMKLIVHHQFKAASILISSTFGWLFVCLSICMISVLTTF